MNPYDTIKAKYEASEHVETWQWWMDWHYRHGFVFSTPDFFAMGHCCIKTSNGGLVGLGFEERHSDTWYIFAMAGDMAKCWSILPYELPWIAFERIRGGKRELAFHRTADLRRLTPQSGNNQPWAEATATH